MDPTPSRTTTGAPPASTPADVYDRIAAKADEIEAEMKRLGWWQPDPIPPAALRFKQPFAADTMTFRQWLQFVFLPKVRDMVRRRQAVPHASTVGSYAVRALEAEAGADQLVSLLTEFDALFGTPQFAYGPAAGRGRFGPVIQAAVWTVVMIAVGVLCVGYGSRLALSDRQDRYSFAIREPASGGYESISLTATAAGPAGGRQRPGEMQLRMFHDPDSPPVGDMTVDLPTRTYQYADANGQPKSGVLDAGAVVAWMYRCGVSAHPAKLNPEAEAVVGFVDEVAKDPAGAFDRARRGGDAADAGRPFRLSAEGSLARDQQGVLPLWVRAGVPAAVWVAGLGVIGLMNRRRG